MEFTVGIIGCGGIARSHVAAYKANNIRIAAVTDVNPAAAEKMGQDNGAAIFPDSESLLRSGSVNIVSICSPPSAHENDAVLALKLGIHVLLEKPQAHTLCAAEHIARSAAESKAKLMMAFRHRFIDANCQIKQIIDSGRIGPPVFFENIFCGPAFSMKDKWFSRKDISGGGVIIDTSSHSIDLFRYFFGDIAEQHAVGTRQLPDIGVEDTGMLLVKSSGGVTGTLISSWVAGIGVARLLVMGQKGAVYYDYTEPEKIILRLREPATTETIAIPSSNGFAAQVKHFITVLQGHADLSCTAEDGLRSMQVIDSVYRELNKKGMA